MKLTSQKLKQIIKEELNNTVNEVGMGMHTYSWEYDADFAEKIAQLFEEEFTSQLNLPREELQALNEEIFKMIENVYDHFAKKIFKVDL
jgi:hypothetical protein